MNSSYPDPNDKWLTFIFILVHLSIVALVGTFVWVWFKVMVEVIKASNG